MVRILRLRAVVATLAWVASVMELTGLSLYAESCSVLSSGLTVCQCTRYHISLLFLPVPRAQECLTISHVTMLDMQGRASMRAYPTDRWSWQPAVRLVLAKSTWESVTRQTTHAARSLITRLHADFRPACVERFTR
jgi:hypothetical protein